MKEKEERMLKKEKVKVIENEKKIAKELRQKRKIVKAKMNEEDKKNLYA